MVSYDECYTLALLNNYTLLSKKVNNINTSLQFLCNICGNKFMESYINIKNNNKGCLKCSYEKFNKKNKK